MSDPAVVLKFGGTSVKDADAMVRVVEITARERGQRPVVVTSASAGITDQLLECARLAGSGDGAAAHALVDRIRTHHLTVLASLALSDGISCEPELRALLDELDDLVDGVMLLQELTPRTVDAFASHGERLSSLLLTAAFRRCGWQAALVDARDFMITDDGFCNAKPVHDEIDRRAPGVVLPLLSENEVVVTQGFVGSTSDGRTTTIGRGGSDHSAAIVGSAIGAREIQIWTDVSGILSADPRVVPTARVIPDVTFTEARELAYFGAKVLHPDTILPAVSRGIPVVILNSMRPDDAGTRILPDSAAVPTGVHAVTVRRGLRVFELTARASGRIEDVLAVFAERGVPLHCSLAVESRAVAAVDPTECTDVLMTALESRASVSVGDDVAILAIIGNGFRTGRGILSPVLSSLSAVATRFVIAGSSEHVALVGIDAADAQLALEAAHEVVIADRG